MKRNNIPTGAAASVLLMIGACCVGGCDRQATTASASASAGQAEAPPPQPTEDGERKKESAELKAKLRVEHPDWSEQQIADYAKGYLGFGISSAPATFENVTKSR